MAAHTNRTKSRHTGKRHNLKPLRPKQGAQAGAASVRQREASQDPLAATALPRFDKTFRVPSVFCMYESMHACNSNELGMNLGIKLHEPAQGPTVLEPNYY
jgi:hypothetical protein